MRENNWEYNETLNLEFPFVQPLKKMTEVLTELSNQLKDEFEKKVTRIEQLNELRKR